MDIRSILGTEQRCLRVIGKITEHALIGISTYGHGKASGLGRALAIGQTSKGTLPVISRVAIGNQHDYRFVGAGGMLSLSSIIWLASARAPPNGVAPQQ